MKHKTIDEKIDIAIAGAGGIGRAAGLVLKEWGDFVNDIYIGDANTKTAKEAADWIKEGSYKNGAVEAFSIPMEGTNDEFNKVLNKSVVTIDCLPGSQAPRIAKLAKEHNNHYANLTEYVKETNEIIGIARDAKTGFILQTGLAPGAINVEANRLFQRFCKEFEVDKIDYLSMNVGALTKNAMEPSYYGFTWSEVGVATEYLEPATVVRNFKKTTRPSLTERSKIVIDGVTYERANTSGGVADLADALEGKVRKLDYMTLRHPGHYEWIDSLLKDIPEGNGRVEKLQAKMEEFVPRCEDDFVVLYTSAQGYDKNNKLRILEKSYTINPMKVGNKNLRAIQVATVIPLAECARKLATEECSGLVTQSQIPPDEFMNGYFVPRVYQ